MPLLSRLAVQAARAYGALSAGKSTNVSASYLVVAGGGGGGAYEGAGGGAGGMLTSTTTLSTLNTYSITVGSGGTSAGSSAGAGNNGSNSVISGTGLSTITSVGGGGGGGLGSQAGKNGGSGGGASSNSTTVGLATSGQGNNGGLGTGVPGSGSGGGGGGAGEAGNTDGAGYGGDGLASSISGSSVTYAGGGAGYNGAGSQGGTGGGGNQSTSGTVNTGGGGGAWDGGSPAGAGGSGIVIISYTSATPKFTGGTVTTSGGKQIHTFTSSGTLSPITPITASYLVVAGGGGGATNTSAGASGGVGGGGAGGLLTSSTTLYSGATYIVTVGAGGAGASSSGASGSQGSTSSLGGTGLTTISTTGGGFGAGTIGLNGGAGGSGGGGYGFPLNTYNGGAGTSGQGNAGARGFTDGSTYTTGGGGGGAGAAATQKTNNSGGDGGIGATSSITGTSTYYAGGGGGGAGPSGSGGTGGLGGGGNGSVAGASAPSGTANTGGGGGGVGGGNSSVFVGGSGGSGIVIISYAGSQVFNGGLVTTSGGNTIHTFTSTGALTPLTNNLNNSLRFRSSASAYLNRTPTVAGNRQKWTWSAWVKRGSLGSRQELFGASPSTGQLDTNNIFIEWRNDDTIVIDGQTLNWRQTTQVFRDPSAWYHLVFAVDTTNATANDRMKLYVNGNQITSFSTTNNPTLNSDTGINATNPHVIGKQPDGSALYLDGYMADVYLIDGQALEPYYFGNNDANGVWKPILYKGTYGVNGFYLTFGNTTSTTTLGYDSSPNGNNWTTNNISLTAGTTYDAMTDVPTNTSATVANYAVVNPINNSASGNITFSQANLALSLGVSGQWRTATATMSMPSGKWYWEVTKTNSTTSNDAMIGIIADTVNISGAYYPSQGALGYTYLDGGQKGNAAGGSAYGATWGINDVIGIAFDADTRQLTFYKNGTSQGLAFTVTSGHSYYPAFGGATTVPSYAINFGQRPFNYSAPSGFLPLNTFNL